MQQNYIIFIDNRCLEIHIDNNLKEEIVVEFGNSVQTVKKGEDLIGMVKYWVEELESAAIDFVKFSTDDIDGLFKLVEDCYEQLIPAAGGAVLNDNGEVLMIYRNEKWDLPKGKMEERETVEQAAVREVKEETGLVNLRVISKLSKTYHTYTLKKKRVLKETFWFLMASNDQDFQPQRNEGITKVVWLPESKLESILSNTYENIKNYFKGSFRVSELNFLQIFMNK